VFRVPGSGGEAEGGGERFLFNSANDSCWYISKVSRSDESSRLLLEFRTCDCEGVSLQLKNQKYVSPLLNKSAHHLKLR
jgi:hypothetical protein